MTALTNDIDAAQVKPSLFILYKPFKIPINDPILILLNNPCFDTYKTTLFLASLNNPCFDTSP